MISFDLNQASIASVTQSNNENLGHDISASFRALASSTSYAYPLLFNPHQDQDYHLQNMMHEQKELGSSHWQASKPSNETYNDDHDLKLSLCTQGDEEKPNIKWMSSKMRIMRKMMMSSDHKIAIRHTRRSMQDQNLANQQNYGTNSPSDAVIRVCSDCNTTKTPLWRSGPRGPKSLCNACGIRQRKARRAMANDGQIMETKLASPAKLAQDKNMFGDQALPFKKRSRISAKSIGNSVDDEMKKKQQLCFKEFSAFNQVFPQDERDAAFLLMDLSCGLIKSS